MSRRVFGFEFALSRVGGGDDLAGWHRIQGHGGLFGNGCLYQFEDGSEPSFDFMCQLKAKCDRMVREEGYALVLVNPDAEPSQRYRRIEGPLRVTNIRVRE